MGKQRSIAQIRQDYLSRKLLEVDVNKDPMVQFELWLEEAIEANCPEPTAMTLATCSGAGEPTARVVLLKGVNNQGFIFFTNYQSRKGMELDANPNAAIVLFWPKLERQVRVEGVVSKISAAESDEYFLARPRGSQIGAWASPQSQIIPNREFLNNEAANQGNRFENSTIYRPSHWGGYTLSPLRIEFWQGRSDRLHDRICFIREGQGWAMSRLAP